MKEKKYNVYIESSQSGGDSFGMTLWKEDVQCMFWGTMQDLQDLGESILEEVKEYTDMCSEMGKEIIVISKEEKKNEIN